MRICILSAIIAVILINDSCAAEQTNQNNLITTYDPGETSSDNPISPRLPSYGQITANDQPDHHPEQHGQIRFEDKSSNQPIKFKDDANEHGYIDKVDADFLLADVSFNDEGNYDRIQFESENIEKKIKFEDSNDEPESLDDRYNNDVGDDSENGTNQVVFEDNVKSDKDSEYSNDYETEEETSAKPIKFENNNDESNLNTKNQDSDRSTVTKRVAFIDDSNNNRESVQKKKRKPRRKPRLQSSQGHHVAMAQNSPYSGLGYPGYPGVGYPGPGYPGPGDPNAGYPGYPMPGYPTPAYPYPAYPSPYPPLAYPTPAYHGYSPYPTMNPGFAYPNPGYQVQGDQTPPVNPAAYPNIGQGEQSGHSDTRYPTQDYGGSPLPGGTLSGNPGGSYPGSEYPYYQRYPVPGYPPAYPGDPNTKYPAQSQAQYGLYSPGHQGTYQPGYQTGNYRPSRKPKSLTQRAVSAVAEALTSIALYDDYQCVPRLLCEVAGGSPVSSPTLLKATAGLQPLLTLLQAYNGASSSPLFIFGRAAVMGVTAKGNPTVCRQSYPQCPNDTEKLVNYLNNHNGGFFRFFGQPEVPQQQQNLEQFYSYLSGQYGFQKQPQQNYEYPSQHGYGLLPQNSYINPQNYGANYYREQNSIKNAKSIGTEIEERIQNKPGLNILEDENDPSSNDDEDKGAKWLFPDETSTKKDSRRERVKTKNESERPNRVSKTLKFPDDRSDDRRGIYKPRDYVRKQKHVFFPGQINFQTKTNYQTTTPVNPAEYVLDHKHNFYVKKPKAVNNDDVVYVVRGNGDPNHPEIVKVKPGQNVL